MRFPVLQSAAGLVEWASRLCLQYERDFTKLLPAKGETTLTASTTTTTVAHSAMGPTRNVTLTPLTANAAAALGTTYVSAKNTGSFVITHANNAQTDRDFDYAITG